MKLLKSKDKKIILTSKEYSQVNKLFKEAKKMSINCEPQLSELLKLSKNKSLWEKIKGSDRDIIRNLASCSSFSNIWLAVRIFSFGRK